jgi:ribonuclease E
MLIDSAHAEEIRVAVIDGERLDRFDFETPSKAPIRGNIYLAKIIRVEPSLQSAFVDYGGEKHGFLGFSEIHPDYFQIPIGDRDELEECIQNAVAARASEAATDEDAELDPREISRLRYQFYRRYKIQEVIKKRQIMLVQVTKEERGNKGATLSTYISLAGRYCVLMPNMSKGSGVSRKVSNHADRQKLKSIVSGLHIKNGSTVIRTAGIGRSKAEIKKDFDFLKNLWDEIRETTLKSTAPCLVYEEAGIIKRSIRDLYARDIESIIVEGEDAHKTAKAFVRKLMPSHAKKVILYNDKKVPLFSKYKINDQINQIYSTRVDLPSGGYLVINTTEALVSIDVNSGRSTRERNIAGTAVKTNMEAASEIARQCRLRDLGGLIVVDFIDMDEKRYQSQVERCLKEALREDKAKIQVGNIGNFGLLEFSRQRLRSSITDVNMVTCPHCRGTGSVWSGEAIALQMLRKIEEACFALDNADVSIVLPQDVILYLLNRKKEFISGLEGHGLKLNFTIDSAMSPFDFRISSIPRSIPSADVENANDSEKPPLATDKQPVATEKHPVATDKQPVATDKQPVATDKQPVATEKHPGRKASGLDRRLRRYRIAGEQASPDSEVATNVVEVAAVVAAEPPFPNSNGAIANGDAVPMIIGEANEAVVESVEASGISEQVNVIDESPKPAVPPVSEKNTGRRRYNRRPRNNVELDTRRKKPSSEAAIPQGKQTPSVVSTPTEGHSSGVGTMDSAKKVIDEEVTLIRTGTENIINRGPGKSVKKSGWWEKLVKKPANDDAGSS